jgi:hypothetical protein
MHEFRNFDTLTHTGLVTCMRATHTPHIATDHESTREQHRTRNRGRGMASAAVPCTCDYPRAADRCVRELPTSALSHLRVFLKRHLA